MRRSMLFDRRLKLNDRRVVAFARRAHPTQEARSALDRMTLRIFDQRILDDRMNGPPLPLGQLVREIAGAGGADGELGRGHGGRIAF